MVPVFPLPNVVLFPGMFLPLHIFEPRYREMTWDALAGERLIAMALFKPGWEDQYEGTPPIREIVGVGKIVEDVRLEDGRYNLVLLGLSRARVLEEVRTTPYRVARVELIDEASPDPKSTERQRRFLLSFYGQLMKEITQGAVAEPPEDLPLGMLCDLVSSLMKMDTLQKQKLLEELDVAVRCGELMKMLAEPRRAWPPRGPSLN